MKWHYLLLLLLTCSNSGYAKSADTDIGARAIALNDEGVHALAKDQFASAIDKLTAALKLDPRFDRAKDNLAIAHNNYGIYLRHSNKAKALEEFHQARFLAEDLTTQKNVRGIIKLLGKNPDSFIDRVDLGNSAQLRSDLVGAIVEYDAALKLKDDPQVEKKLDYVYRLLNEREKAIASTSFHLPRYANAHSKEIGVLESWVVQLNDAVKIAFDYQNPEPLRHEQNNLAVRLVYGIDEQLDKLESCVLSPQERSRITKAMDNMSHTSSTLYEQVSVRKRKKNSNKSHNVDRSNLDAAPKAKEQQIASAEKISPTQQKQISSKQTLSEKEPDVDEARRLSEDDLKHGQEQVKRMICDRPEMARYVHSGDEICDWCAHQFAGEYTGSRFFWNGHDSDKDGARGWHVPPYQGRRGSITVGQFYYKAHSGEELWSIAIYELLNIRNDAAFLKWERHADFGKVSQHELFKYKARLEYETLKKRFRFYEDYWLPHCKRMHLTAHNEYWSMPSKSTFEEWFKEIPEDSYYRKHYGGY